jgi:signal transduction histidine kinase
LSNNTNHAAGAEEAKISVAALPPTPRQRQFALALMGLMIVGFAALTPFVLIPLPRWNGFVPAVQTVIAATDFVTAILLFGQFGITRSRALLLLANGYLFCSSAVTAHTLTFPGAFAPAGLFGAGPQTAAWLYVFWHLGLPVAAVGYTLLWGSGRDLVKTSIPVAITVSAVTVVGTVCALTWSAIAGGTSLPQLVVTETGFSELTHWVTATTLVVTLLALALVWQRRASVLDYWLMVALVALTAEAATITFVAASRFTFAFYSVRTFDVVVGCSVLAALIWEMTRLYAKLSIAVRNLERERANKLMNLEIMVASIAHEIKQPLTVIATRSGIVRRLLKHTGVEVDQAQRNLDEMENASLRVSQVFDNIRALFKNPGEGQQLVDLNELALESLNLMQSEASDHGIVVMAELARAPTHVSGHRGQLQEVLVNLVQNAIDAMDEVQDRPRTLRVCSAIRGEHVTVSVEDSGAGIDPQRLAGLFDAFVTTKPRGVGLGLGICRLIVDHHRGRLSASSELNKGSCFEITLPISGASHATMPARPPTAIARARTAAQT